MKEIILIFSAGHETASGAITLPVIEPAIVKFFGGFAQ